MSSTTTRGPGALPRTVAVPLKDVELLPGVQWRSREQMAHLARVYPLDRLLAVFRANAGLDTGGAPPPGTWEDHGHPDERAWNEGDYPGAEAASTANLLRGHYAGHFLSMLALTHAATGEAVFRDRAHALVEGLAQVQSALAATGRFSHPGFLAAYGEWQFSRLEGLAPYGEIWAPYYTCHKLLAGLLDAHEHTGSARALEVATAMGHWVSARVARLDREHLQRMWSLYIAGEFGGMGESLVTLYRRTGVPDFLEAASRFEVDAVLSAAAEGRDVLAGMHANQHLPMLVAHLEQYEVTGEVRYLDAVRTLWDQIVPGRTFAHGGTGEGELWGPADTVAGFIGHRNAECCAAYNLLKIARLLFEHTLDVRYGDYLERAALNHVVGARADVDSDTSPEVLYMFPVGPGAVREYDNVGTCCGGTGLESHVKQTEAVWFSAAGDGVPVLHLVRYVPSTVSPPGLPGSLTLETDYPRTGAVSLRVDVDGPMELRLRLPEWVRGTTSWRLRVRGVDVARPRLEGGFVVVTDVFSRGDAVELDLPLPLRAEPTLDDPAVVNLQLGASVLLARDERTTMLEVALAGHRRLDGTLDHVRRGDGGVDALGLRFEPAWSGGTSRYHTYVRVVDPTIAFLGRPTGVPDRRGLDGWSFLASLWSRAPFATFAEFTSAVHAEVVRAVAAGLMTTSEASEVFAAAATSPLDGWRLPRWSLAVAGPVEPPAEVDGAPVEWTLEGEAGSGSDVRTWTARVVATGELAAQFVVWPELAVTTAAVVPVVRVGVRGERTSSGWFTTTPSVIAEVISVGGADEPRISIDGDSWEPSTRPRPLGEGVHHVRVRAGAGGAGEMRIAVDTRPPEVRVGLRALGPSSVQVTIEADDAVSGVDRIRWRTPETFWGVYQEPFTRQLRAQEQVLEVIATDRAGNETTLQRVVLPAARP